MLQSEIKNSNTQNAIVKLITGIETQGENFKFEEYLDEDYFKESEKIMIIQGAKGGRPDRAFLVVAQWLGKELLSEK